MRWVFALSLVFIVCAYAGYPLWAYVKSVWRPRPVRSAPIFPRISIVIAARNEAQALPRKMENLSAIDYPPGQREVIVVSDGSTDSTMEVFKRWESENARLLILPQRQGKAAALNLGVQSANGDIIVFTDARQQIEPDAIRNLVANFADPEVGCVSGELMLGAGAGPQTSAGVGLYWRLEKMIRQWESASGSVVGATGALYAARKELLTTLPPGTILDDVYNPLQVCRKGKRVIFEPRARAWDEMAGSEREFQRKVRTLTGNYQLLQLAPWALTRSNPVRLEFIAHKLMRLLVPFALIALFLSSWFLPGTLSKAAVALQLIFYGLALLTLTGLRMGALARFGDVALAFLLLNTAAAVALVYFITGKKEVWVR
ncbi:MAG: glycosyltransferase family 2 protein [Terriglobia bacterium]